MRLHGPTEKYYKTNNRSPWWDLIVWLLLIVAIFIFCISCKKEASVQPGGPSAQTQSSTGTLKIKLQCWYNNDSVLFSPNHPCGSIKQCYVKDSAQWFSYSGPKTGFVSTITVQQTSAAFLVQDSIIVSIYIDGTLNKIVSGKKFLTTTYTY